MSDVDLGLKNQRWAPHFSDHSVPAIGALTHSVESSTKKVLGPAKSERLDGQVERKPDRPHSDVEFPRSRRNPSASASPTPTPTPTENPPPGGPSFSSRGRQRKEAELGPACLLATKGKRKYNELPPTTRAAVAATAATRPSRPLWRHQHQHKHQHKRQHRRRKGRRPLHASGGGGGGGGHPWRAAHQQEGEREGEEAGGGAEMRPATRPRRALLGV